MKQSILFEQGKLYVVELPDIRLFKCMPDCYDCEKDYRDAYNMAVLNKVEVNNPELILKGTDDYLKDFIIRGVDIILKGGGTIPLPVDITFDKETGCLKRIEPEKMEPAKANMQYDFRVLEEIDNSKFNKRINTSEPEKPEEKSLIQTQVDYYENKIEAMQRIADGLYKENEELKERLKVEDTQEAVMSKFSNSEIGSHHWATTLLSFIMRVGEYMSEYGAHPKTAEDADRLYKSWGALIKERAIEINSHIVSKPENFTIQRKKS